MPIPQGDWEGWATTTQFGSGDAVWPGNYPSLCLKNIMGRKNTMGAAVPWSVIAGYSGYANRKDFLEAIIRSCQGLPGSDGKIEEVCYLIEPVSKYPNEITNGEPFVDVCSSGCTNINDPSLAATITMPDGSKKNFGPYLIVPYEGCGGDCSSEKGVPDCFNSCSDIQNVIADFKNAVVTNTNCEGVKILMNTVNGVNTWKYDSTIEEKMLAAGFADVPISSKTSYGKNIDVLGGHANWCMGQNMHFDIAQDVPDWISDLPPGATSNIRELNANSNIVVRYRKVAGNIFGNFHPEDPQPDVCFAGGYAGGQNNTCNGVLSQVYTSVAAGCLAEGSDKPLEVSCCCPYGSHFDKEKKNCCTNADPNICCDPTNLDSCSGKDCASGSYSIEKNCCVLDDGTCMAPPAPTPTGGSDHCYQGQSFQAPGAPCPCEKGTCFTNPSDTRDKTPGKCGKCSPGTAAECAGWSGQMC
jgi:hypothetical protein